MHLLDTYQEVRARTVALAAPLSAEDQMVQSMPEASPTKWHLAHTTWFFETFVLAPSGGARLADDLYRFLFNSYYEVVGPRQERAHRGRLSRPSLAEVHAYRRRVDEAIARLCGRELEPAIVAVLELGVAHEEQHQELILTDAKHALGTQPARPAYREARARPDESDRPTPARFHAFAEGVVSIGHGGDEFAFDNEAPRHRTFVHAFALADRPATCAEYLDFMRDGGYERPELWLSDGWQRVQAERWRAPLYWEERDGAWTFYTLSGVRAVEPDEAVAHVSYFEADAFARWAGARLPTEQEWERAAADAPVAGHFAGSERFHPGRARAGLYGDVWQWTRSPYAAYPGYRPPPGALGEYNGKFMCNQMVLRGGSCLTPTGHMRATYRNFFPPEARWQMSGIRLARDA
jgi:ergothioneine biosynthesis protein EgtB